MSTDQTTPPPAGSTLPGSVLPGSVLPGSAGSAADLDSAAELASGPDRNRAGDLNTGLDGEREADRDPDRAAGPDGHLPAAAPDQPPAADPARRPVGSSWQAEASGDLVAMSFPGARRIAGWLFWLVFPLLCIATLQTSVTSMVHHLGNKPVGIRGSFVVQPRSCSQGFCSFGGLFSSDDGTIKNLPLLGDPRWRTAEVHKVTYDPRSVEVSALPGHWNPTPTVMAIIGALAYLGTIGYFLRQRRRSGQHRRSAAAEPDPVPTG
jgi:hypothetical protein